jgi:aminoacylase
MKLISSINQFLEFRASEEAKLGAHSGCKHAVALKLGDVTTLNLTVLKGGVTPDNGATYAYNVVPMEAEAGFDIRIPPAVDLAEFEDKIKEWTSEGGYRGGLRDAREWGGEE